MRSAPAGRPPCGQRPRYASPCCCDCSYRSRCAPGDSAVPRSPRSLGHPVACSRSPCLAGLSRCAASRAAEPRVRLGPGGLPELRGRPGHHPAPLPGSAVGSAAASRRPRRGGIGGRDGREGACSAVVWAGTVAVFSPPRGTPAASRPRFRRESSGSSGSGEPRSGLAGRARQRQPELRAAARLAPGLQPAAVQPRVLQRDGQPQTGAAGGPGPGRVGPPEAVEDHGRLARPEPDAVVAHRDRDRAASPARAVTTTSRPSPCSTALTTRLRRMRSTRRASTSATTGCSVADHQHRCPCARPAARPPSDHPPDHLAQVDGLGLQRGGAGVEAADLQQVGEQRLEPVQLALQQFRGPARSTGSKSSRASWRRRPPSAPWSAASAARARRRRRTGAAPGTAPPAAWIFSWRFWPSG